jgi:hypothetical protein
MELGNTLAIHSKLLGENREACLSSSTHFSSGGKDTKIKK